MEKRAATVILLHPLDKNLVLGVSRKDDHTAWGMPGGKLDPGEDFTQAAIREMFEETGIKVSQLKEIWHGLDAGGYNTTTFLVLDRPDNLTTILRGEFPTTEAGKVKWCTWDELTSGPFKDYNTNIHKLVEENNYWDLLMNHSAWVTKTK